MILALPSTPPVERLDYQNLQPWYKCTFSQGAGKTTLAKQISRIWKCHLIDGELIVLVTLSLKNSQFYYTLLIVFQVHRVLKKQFKKVLCLV